MEHLTIDQAIEHLQDMAESLKKYKEKYPNAKYKGVQLSLDWWRLEEAKRNGDSIWYWSINWEEIWISLSFSTKNEDNDFNI